MVALFIKYYIKDYVAKINNPDMKFSKDWIAITPSEDKLLHLIRYFGSADISLTKGLENEMKIRLLMNINKCKHYPRFIIPQQDFGC